jgi:hypothetical protein
LSLATAARSLPSGKAFDLPMMAFKRAAVKIPPSAAWMEYRVTTLVGKRPGR